MQIYKKMLDSLGVIYETEKIKKEQIDVPIYVLFEELDRYNERFKIVGLDNILRNICKDFCLGKIFDSTVVTGLFIMTETDYGFSAVTCMNDLSRKNNLERLEKIRKGLSILDPKSKDEEIMQLYKLGLYEDPLMSL